MMQEPTGGGGDELAGASMDMPSGSGGAALGNPSSLGERVRTACAYGNYEALREAADSDPEVLSTADELGYLPLQWAALNNRVAIVAFLLERGADVNRCCWHVPLHYPACRQLACMLALHAPLTLHAQNHQCLERPIAEPGILGRQKWLLDAACSSVCMQADLPL